jgi:protein transport protein SEC61 subunit gamma-like protein
MNTPTDLSSYIRVLKLASTPSWNEFSQVAKIAGGGILLVGFIGFIIFIFMTFVPGGPGIPEQPSAALLAGLLAAL